MTTLTQSELDDMRAAWRTICNGNRIPFGVERLTELAARSIADVPRLLDHIAQLTAERDAAEKQKRQIVDEREQAITDLRKSQARIAELEAKPSASDEMRRTARELRENANGDCGAVAQAIFWDKKAAALETQAAQPSAQFVAGMQRAAGIARTFGDLWCSENPCPTCEKIANAILAEAALKGEGE